MFKYHQDQSTFIYVSLKMYKLYIDFLKLENTYKQNGNNSNNSYNFTTQGKHS